MGGKMQVYSKAKITQKMQMYRQLAIDRQKRIDELESQLTWINVNDELPKENKETMRYISLSLVLNNRTVVQGGFHYGDFYLDGHKISNVTHWMSMPKFKSIDD